VNNPKGLAKSIEAAIEPIKRIELLIASAQQNFRDREIKPVCSQRLAVALDMLNYEVIALRRVLYGDQTGP
jgi:hypothetical protein